MGAGERQCDGPAATIFVTGIVAGTLCVISSKALFECKARGISGELEPFQAPVLETFIMFFGMLFALPLYLGMEGYKRLRAINDPEARANLDAAPVVTTKMVFSLAIPAIFDLSSVLFLMSALMFVPASMWQLLRGSSIVFVALMKQFGLNSPLTSAMWVGVFTILVAVILVGLSATLTDEPSADGRRQRMLAADASDEEVSAASSGDSAELLVGIGLTMAGTFMQSLQYAYEEKVMSGDNPAPPWLLIGMEGVFGSLLTLCVVYPLAGYMPGRDHGSFENIDNTVAQLNDNPDILTLSAVFCLSVFVLNSFSVLVTFMLSSVWHAILDNFRPISIWATQLLIYEMTDGAHGEKWTNGSYLQLTGLAVMLLGTAIYNGTVKVPGLPVDDLLASNSLVASPALNRSPLLTKNAAPGSEFGSKGSPYAPRAQIDVRGDKGLKDKLIINVKK